MITQLRTLCTGMAFSLLSTAAMAQAVTSDFESLSLGVDGYWNGSDLAGGFQDGEAWFENAYDTAWGSWSGFSYANLVDVTTAGYTNQYSTFAGEGYNGSDKFAVANVNPYATTYVRLNTRDYVDGFYVTNNTYAGLSMRDGDMFGKAFGADTLPNGADTNYLGEPITGDDWFKITVFALIDDSVHRDTSVSFYLADYRSALDANDYIVDYWAWVDLQALGMVDGLHFELTSSDVGAGGMNTPSYFCMDNLVVGEVDGTAERLQKAVSMYPNPASDRLHLQIPADQFSVSIVSLTGQVWMDNIHTRTVDVATLPVGVYLLKVEVDGTTVTKRFQKL